MSKLIQDSIIEENHLKIEPKNSRYFELSQKLLSGLSKRSKEIIEKRFGLFSGEEETLEKIGRHYGITRERVRQIIFEARKNLSKNFEREEFSEAEKEIILSIEARGGIIKEEEMVSLLGGNDSRESSALRFFVGCSGKIIKKAEKELIEKSLAVSERIAEEAKKIIIETEKIINKEKKLLSEEEIALLLGNVFQEISPEKIERYLKSAKRIKKSHLGKWGISHWPEVSPKGTREKAHLVLKHHRKPLHFVDIAKKIDELGLGRKKAHPQTVHNELIKNEKFVLIGRGIYALREWGYYEGTIREVIERILSVEKKPMKKEKIIEEVLKVRKVKETTIMINLNNRRYFLKKGDNYFLKN